MELSVVIPTYRRPAKLAACLRALARQTLPATRYQVLVGIDGPDPESQAAARQAWEGCSAELTVLPCPRSGYNTVRNQLLAAATGQYLLSLNDDVVPCSTLLETHLREQIAATQRGRPAVVSGYSPWRRWSDPNYFDEIVARTSLIFFYDQMSDDKVAQVGPMHDWGFRHCYGLNFSAPLQMVRESGGFVAFPLAYGYDDIELAFRLSGRYGTPVLFRPDALAEHNHRYGPREVLDREFKLGHSAWHFAGRDPAFCEAVFRRDIRSHAEIAYSREFLERERSLAVMVEHTCLTLDSIPAPSVHGSNTDAMLRMTYLHLLPLKRWMWRAGLIAAAEDRPQDVIDYPGV
ncbi:MAG: glycosyltransferase [Phycisphaerales bacterium]|nr:glycosyltransferase [Phycisphaerales bacterium]